MTSNAISNLAGATGYQMSAPKAQQNAEQSFSDMLRQTALTVQSPADGVQQTAQPVKEQPKQTDQQQTDTQPADNQQTDEAKEPKTQDAQKSAEKEQVQQTEETAAEEPKQEEETGEPDAVLLSDVMQQILQQITEQLGVSPEEVLQAMDALGISTEDLSQNMAALLSELTGTDQMAVLTDESLYTQVSDLANAVESDSYTTSLARLASGQADVMVSYGHIRTKYAPEWKETFGGTDDMVNQTGVIGVTDKIYNDMIAYSKTSEVMQDEDFRQALGDSFIEIANTDEGKDIISVFSQVGYEWGDDANYDGEREAQELLKSME